VEERDDHSQPEGDGDPQEVARTPLQRFERHIWRKMGAGFLVLVPLLVTIVILQLVFIYVDGVFRGEGGLFTGRIDGTPLDFPGVGVIFFLIVLYIVGLLVAWAGRSRVVRWQSVVLSRVPVVKTIYGVAQQATDALTSPSGHRFSRVVFLEWPRPGVTAMGFVTGHCHFPAEERTLLVVYIPTVPNPTSGMLAFVPEHEIMESDLTVEDAMKVVFSGGIVLPESMSIRSSASLTEQPPQV